VTLQIPKEIEDRLESVAQRTGRSKDECAREAIAEFVESEEDYLVAVERLKQNHPGIPLEEVERRLGLAD
jgi:RHH-type transcriptional regulator, rel operon repressor / antitoxin RelB